MIEQHTKNFNDRFLNGDTPWEQEKASEAMMEFFQKIPQSKGRVLDIGCSLGCNSIWLAQKGYQVVGIDVASEAIRLSKIAAAKINLDIDFQVLDFMSKKISRLGVFDIIFDRGCFHSFISDVARARFANNVASLLKDKGYWFNISGSIDNNEDSNEINKQGCPRLTNQQITEAAKEYFEIESIKCCLFYNEGIRDNFKAWSCTFRKRKNKITIE